MRARYYDPSTGLFLSRDPVLGPLDTPLEHGEYLYARNNPINLSDPSGELAITATADTTIGYYLAGGGDVGFVIVFGDNGIELGTIYSKKTAISVAGGVYGVGISGGIQKAISLADLTSGGSSYNLQAAAGPGFDIDIGTNFDSLSLGIGLGYGGKVGVTGAQLIVFDWNGNWIPNRQHREMLERINNLIRSCKL